MKKFNASVYIKHDVTGIEAESELDVINKLRNYISKDEDFMVFNVVEQKEENDSGLEKFKDSISSMVDKHHESIPKPELVPNPYYKEPSKEACDLGEAVHKFVYKDSPEENDFKKLANDPFALYALILLSMLVTPNNPKE